MSRDEYCGTGLGAARLAKVGNPDGSRWRMKIRPGPMGTGIKDLGLLVPGDVDKQVRRRGNRERAAGPKGGETRPEEKEEVWTEMAGVL